ncbi:FMN-dependent NADH-azoreductase [Cribrihabitans marinus]|uniref:FMN dependent NADH:quinone oxidoreductase n=1 Tax=Cribrihabitans marinus TaxID=1227549 RepID=A0A1H7CYQ4_9RHOB|nr:NAD(P)H-dependent oxidoreductase [Cribrihabitans marinus]GGH37111.1 FMN-dependent NADH-azoreductase [Cribrihabitans marinus]SEJ94788.1 FMN-dependent NADH-azoreductase [Cribrihabitans marinus]
MTTTVLHIDASARRQGSVTRSLSQRIVTRLAPDRIIRRDLTTALPQITGDWIAANQTPADQRSADQRAELAQSDALLAELQASDTVVIGLPVYNFSVPAALKAWIDLVARAGISFRYTEQGPVGLLTGKRAILAVASGGTQVGSEIDFATTYMRHILGFVGITDVQIVAADRMALDPEAALSSANQAADRLAA